MAGALTTPTDAQPTVAIACGGTGGHLFPGLAVGTQLLRCGCRVSLLISSKEVDRQAVQGVRDMEIVTLPAVGLVRGGKLAFARGFSRSYRVAREAFRRQTPQAALAMGGFTSAAPILAAKRFRIRTFLHESNSIPGRANRWLSWMVDQAFVGFPAAASRLHSRRVLPTGTPVRAQFQPRDGGACRQALGLAPDRPVVCVLGGSQGASGINQLIIKSLPLLKQNFPRWQWIHLTGPSDFELVKSAYAGCHADAVVFPFLSDMEVALGAASAAVSRAGASSLSELAAMRVPAVLIPYPAAADDHQSHNARAFTDSGAARMLAQRTATAETLLGALQELIEDPALRSEMQAALRRWHAPKAAEDIAGAILQVIGFSARLGRDAVMPDTARATPARPPTPGAELDSDRRLRFA